MVPPHRQTREPNPAPLGDVHGARHRRNGRSRRPRHTAVLRAGSVPACLDKERARRFLLQAHGKKNMLGTKSGEVLSPHSYSESSGVAPDYEIRNTEYASSVQNLSPTARLRNSARGAICWQAAVKARRKRGEHTCRSVNSIEVPISRSFKSSTNSWFGGNPRGGRVSLPASSQLSR